MRPVLITLAFLSSTVLACQSPGDGSSSEAHLGGADVTLDGADQADAQPIDAPTGSDDGAPDSGDQGPGASCIPFTELCIGAKVYVCQGDGETVTLVEACAEGQECVDGACVTPCVPHCDGAECGDDGCGGSCGSCADGACEAGSCVVACQPDCAGLACGDDGCGGSCGTCGSGTSCGGGQCVADCVPACSGKVCGSDGCGGSCGGCPSGHSCNDGQCLAPIPSFGVLATQPVKADDCSVTTDEQGTVFWAINPPGTANNEYWRLNADNTQTLMLVKHHFDDDDFAFEGGLYHAHQAGPARYPTNSVAAQLNWSGTWASYAVASCGGFDGSENLRLGDSIYYLCDDAIRTSTISPFDGPNLQLGPVVMPVDATARNLDGYGDILVWRTTDPWETHWMDVNEPGTKHLVTGDCDGRSATTDGAYLYCTTYAAFHKMDLQTGAYVASWPKEDDLYDERLFYHDGFVYVTSRFTGAAHTIRRFSVDGGPVQTLVDSAEFDTFGDLAFSDDAAFACGMRHVSGEHTAVVLKFPLE